MSQEIEIEYKVLLTKVEFDRLAKNLPFPDQGVEQTNYYFDTKVMALKNVRCALRIRKKGNTYTLTLKEPHSDGILETHDTLTEKEFVSWINGTPIPKPNITKQLQQLQIDEANLVYLGALTTLRKTFMREEIEYVLDQSMYNGKTDYELEIEAPTHEKGLPAFQKILQAYKIKERKSVTKIERFFYSLT
ncbi:CYTH domain-containing protein [Pseudogracilibacillus auburnensis]|uniref:Uncharacterized protein YjbK n=1 Tax=Pseudogracilibacillus auburnensis TaxID=1494959 RepID=A0A2V3W1T4_9BACI|nr:CYTH domain-containing protein [Pseudogracilibacillus auburnensis]PXW87068.1 uncharacterized protein YjbK [Pseudogracilibacillus auburnensis]